MSSTDSRQRPLGADHVGQGEGRNPGDCFEMREAEAGGSSALLVLQCTKRVSESREQKPLTSVSRPKSQSAGVAHVPRRTVVRGGIVTCVPSPWGTAEPGEAPRGRMRPVPRAFSSWQDPALNQRCSSPGFESCDHSSVTGLC